MDKISKQMFGLLEHIGDAAVGGTHVTPGIEDYATKEVRRSPMTQQRWSTWQGVHFNPTARQIKSMSKNFTDVTFQDDFDDVVGQMDFDFYRKDGTPKEKNPPTWRDVINNMKEEGIPLPYCVVPSGTPGNFHMLWLLDKPKPRGYFQTNADILRYWGADPNFTNSLSYNPEYRVNHPSQSGEVTHWWDEWSDKVDLVHNIMELAGVGYHTCVDDSYSKRPWSSEGRVMKSRRSRDRKERISYPKLLARMSGAVDGDGRFHLLCAYTRRNIASFFRAHKRPAMLGELREIVEDGNSLFGEPISQRRYEYIVRYWKVTRQEQFMDLQYRAGMSNFKARESRLDTMRFYFQILDLREEIAKFENGENHSLTEEQLQRAKMFSGRRLHRQLVTTAYLTYVANVYTEENIDMDTGEVLQPELDVRRIVNLLRNGPKRGYNREELDEGYEKLRKDIEKKNASRKKYKTINHTESSEEESTTKYPSLHPTAETRCNKITRVVLPIDQNISSKFTRLTKRSTLEPSTG